MAKVIEGWFNDLEGGRLEIFLKVSGVPDALKLRASGERDEMYELVEWFEQASGLTVDGLPNRVRRGQRPMPGQTSILELSSQDATVQADGELS